MYKERLKQIIEDLEDLIADIIADETNFDVNNTLVRTLDEASTALEDAKRML
jgi:hypothetical protein